MNYSYVGAFRVELLDNSIPNKKTSQGYRVNSYGNNLGTSVFLKKNRMLVVSRLSRKIALGLLKSFTII